MPLPVDVSTRQVHGAWLDMEGNPRAGHVTFTPTAERLINPGTDTIITGTTITAHLADGEILVELPCTDDEDLEGGPFSYLVTVHLLGDEQPYAFWIDLPADEDPLKLADVTPIIPAGGGSNLVFSVNSKTGHVTLSPADIGAENAGAATAALASHLAASDPHGDRAYAVQRANHTGTQSYTTITGLGNVVTRNIGTTTGTAAAGDDYRLVGTGRVRHAYDYGYRSGTDAAANVAGLQAAIDAVAALGGGTVVLPLGTGYINASIELKPFVRLMGQGMYATRLYLVDGSNCHMIINHVSTNGTSDPNAMFCGVYDLCLIGNGVNQVGTWDGIHFTTNPIGTPPASSDPSNDAKHRIERVYTRNMSGSGFYIRGRSDSVLFACDSYLSGRYGYELGPDTTAIGCVADKSSLAGFYCNGSSVRLVSCKAFNNGKDGSAFNGQTAVPDSGHGFHLVGLHDINLSACQAQNVAGGGYVLEDLELATLQGCVAAGMSEGNSGSDWAGFTLDNVRACRIDGVVEVGGAEEAVYLTGGSNRNDITLTHYPYGAASPTDPIRSGSALLSNRLVVNGVTIHSPGQYTPSVHGLVASAGDPRYVSTTGQITAGVIFLAKVRATRTVMTSIKVTVGTAGSGLTAGQNLLGIYSLAGTRLGVTADQTTAWGSTGEKSADLTAPITVTLGDEYLVAILSNGTTPPAFVRYSSASYAGTYNLGLTGANVDHGTYGTTQTALPASITPGSIAGGGWPYWVGVA